MAIATVRRLSLLCAALMSTTALTLVGTAQAQSKVGVTSATDGDPLGKPPSENERVLRIGIDVQANEVVTTHGNDRAHLVFLDGSSLTVGPNARLTIDKFVYDPNTKTGELAVTASQGVLRFVGGRISKTSPVTINTPSGTIGIRGGIGIFGVGSRQDHDRDFLFGHSMTVTDQGQTQTMTRPSSYVIVNTGALSQPAQPAAARRPHCPRRSARRRRLDLRRQYRRHLWIGRDGLRRQRRQRRLEGAEFRPFRQQLRRRQFGAAGKSAGHRRWPAEHQ